MLKNAVIWVQGVDQPKKPNKLIAARLAADVSNTPTILIARTDADALDLPDIDDRDLPFLTAKGPQRVSLDPMLALIRLLLEIGYAPYSDLVWCEHPNLVLRKPKNLLRQSRKIIQKLCWLTTVHLHSTGRKTSMTQPLLNTRKSSVPWDTNSNSSL